MDLRRLRLTTMAAIGLTALVIAMPAVVRAADVGVELHGGTLGAGAGLAVGLSDRWNTRIGFNKLSMEDDFTEDGIDYTADLELESVHLLADWHPFYGGFRLTGGVLYNNNELSGDATVDAGDEIGGETVPAGGGGSMAAAVTFRDAAPYLGIGWGNAAHGWSPVAFSLDIGVLGQGSPRVDLENEGVGGVSDADVEQEEQDLEDELEDFKLYPVIAAGVVIRF